MQTKTSHTIVPNKIVPVNAKNEHNVTNTSGNFK